MKLQGWLFSAVLCAHAAFGYDARHGPFEDNAAPKPFPVTLLAPSDRQLKVTVETNHNIFARVLDKRGRVVAGPFKIAAEVEWGGVGDVYAADFNRDGKIDFVVQVWWGGCGLAAGNYELGFLLSSPTGYVARTITTMFPGTEDFVDVREDGSCQFIQTGFVHGPVHNHWLYNLYEIRGDELLPADYLLPGFPKRVRHSSRPHPAVVQPRRVE